MNDGIIKRLEVVASRLEAWQDGERIARASAEERQDRDAVMGHYNRGRNYQSIAETLRDIMDDLS